MAGGHQAPDVPLASLLLLGLLCSPTEMASVRCFSAMDSRTFTCTDLIGDEIEENDCCLNPSYCFQREPNGKSILCQPVSQWGEWMDWSPCSVSCEEGAQQRRRFCLGLGECGAEEWLQARTCMDNPCCQVDGGWSAWTPWGPCSVTCATGQQRRSRSCTQPPPSCGGQCHGAQENHRACDTKQTCPTHGSWSSWGPWGLCSASCRQEGSGRDPVRNRTRTCSNPPPSEYPPGRQCPGGSEDTSHCDVLPFCPVAGNWGPWNAASPCTVSCGVGKESRHRRCDQPAPKHGGDPCWGNDTTHTICNTGLHCPVDGLWTPWETWTRCIRRGFSISCRRSAGQQSRTRQCKGMAHGGSPCHGPIIQVRSCYDASRCPYGTGIWTEWGDWGLCQPPCGPGSVRSRRRTCRPVYPAYPNETGLVKKVPVIFWGEPKFKCAELDGQEKEVVDTKPCFNVPACD